MFCEYSIYLHNLYTVIKIFAFGKEMKSFVYSVNQDAMQKILNLNKPFASLVKNILPVHSGPSSP